MKQFSVGIIILAATVLVLVSCQSGFKDNTGSYSQAIPILSGEYGSPVWLDENHAAFTHGPRANDNGPWDYRIVILTINTGEWRELPLPARHETCSETAPVGVGNLRRLPNGNLGFIFQCHIEPSGGRTMLYMWDKETDSLQILRNYLEFFYANWFTFSPDMSRLIQATGSGMDDRLYWIAENDVMEQLLPNFQRASRPHWSFDGTTVAFRGTKTYPGGNAEDLRTWEEMRGLLFYPWDLYVMDRDGNNVRLILSGIEEPGDVQWVPEHNALLSFGGDYRGNSGVWIINIESNQVTRIWPYRTNYSWSPNGKQMIVFETKQEDGEEYSRPVIIDMSIDELN